MHIQLLELNRLYAVWDTEAFTDTIFDSHYGKNIKSSYSIIKLSPKRNFK